MPSLKLTALPSTPTVVGADLVYVVTDVGGTPTSNKATVSVLASAIGTAAFPDITDNPGTLVTVGVPLALFGSAASPSVISAVGADSNIPLRLTPKGSSRVEFSSLAVIIPNGGGGTPVAGNKGYCAYRADGTTPVTLLNINDANNADIAPEGNITFVGMNAGLVMRRTKSIWFESNDISQDLPVLSMDTSNNLYMGNANIAGSNQMNDTYFQVQTGKTFYWTVNAVEMANLSVSGLLLSTNLGRGAGAFEYGFDFRPASGVAVSKTAIFQDATATAGITKVVVKSGAAQSTNTMLEFRSAADVLQTSIYPQGLTARSAAGGKVLIADGDNGVRVGAAFSINDELNEAFQIKPQANAITLAANKQFCFTTTNNAPYQTVDTSMCRISAGLAGFGTGAAGSFAGGIKLTKIEHVTGGTLGFYGTTPITQGASVADASGGATIDAEARTAINALISRVEALGLIATV
jgi:hypothetical protein